MSDLVYTADSVASVAFQQKSKNLLTALQNLLSKVRFFCMKIIYTFEQYFHLCVFISMQMNPTLASFDPCLVDCPLKT